MPQEKLVARWSTNGLTAVDMTPNLEASKLVCGVYFPVHFVVKYHPCDGQGPDWELDGYTGPSFLPLSRDDQIEAP